MDINSYYDMRSEEAKRQSRFASSGVIGSRLMGRPRYGWMNGMEKAFRDRRIGVDCKRMCFTWLGSAFPPFAVMLLYLLISKHTHATEWGNGLWAVPFCVKGLILRECMWVAVSLAVGNIFSQEMRPCVYVYVSDFTMIIMLRSDQRPVLSIK